MKTGFHSGSYMQPSGQKIWWLREDIMNTAFVHDVFIYCQLKAMDEKMTAFVFKTRVRVANEFPEAQQFKDFMNMIFEYQFE